MARLSNGYAIKRAVAGVCGLLSLVFAAPAQPAAARDNDFPTQARVEFVLSCMNDQGGQTYDTLYGCVCLVDRMARHYSYAEFVKTQTLAFLYSTPGERGGVFRDGVSEARDKVRTFKEVDEAGRKTCFPTSVSG